MPAGAPPWGPPRSHSLSHNPLLLYGGPQAPTPGKSLKVTYTPDNKSGQNIQSSVMGITLPDDVTYTSSSSKPMASAGTLVEGAVTWANGGAIKAGGSKTFTGTMGVR